MVEKGSEVGAHILSGAILEPTALDELVENWRDLSDCPVKVQVNNESLNFLTETNSYSIPKFFIPPAMHNKGKFYHIIRFFLQMAFSTSRKPRCRNLSWFRARFRLNN